MGISLSNEMIMGTFVLSSSRFRRHISRTRIKHNLDHYRIISEFPGFGKMNNVALVIVVASFAIGAMSKSVSTTTKCHGICPLILMPVCGSNGETYANRCGLNQAACEADEMGLAPINLAHTGPCDKRAKDVSTTLRAERKEWDWNRSRLPMKENASRMQTR